ncbi:MAG: hypothetical protein ABIQ01_11535 [Pseudolysinimonas sp.]
MEKTRRRRWPWIIGAVIVVLLIPVAVIAVPILTHRDQGVSHQVPSAEEWPLTAAATGDDGRERTIEISAADATGAPAGEADTSALRPGDLIVVTGSGYDPDRGIYVAICAIPDDPTTKPGPCLGGIPAGGEQDVEEGAVQFAPSNWINDDWAWKLFGARSYDDREAGTFTAYLEVPEASDDHVDCRAVACAVYTRNDHTAAADRVQDLSLPIAFAS